MNQTCKFILGLTRPQKIILLTILLILCITLGCLATFLVSTYKPYLKAYYRPEYTEETLHYQSDFFFIQNITDFETSDFCNTYKCKFEDNYESAGITNNMYIVNSYPNEYNNILIEINTIKSKISDFGLTLDGRQPYVNSDDLIFVYSFLTSMSNGNKLSPEIERFIKENIEIEINQICQANSIDFGSKRIWIGRTGIVPTLYVSDNCSN